MKSKLALGTAQFGLDYGISNKTGQVRDSEAIGIINIARKMGLTTIDTAMAYGESESRLGLIGVEEFEIITKLPEFTDRDFPVRDWVESQINGSITRLRVDHLHGVLLHRPQQVLGSYGNEIVKALENLKELGKIRQIGVSIYSPNELEAIMNKIKIDIVQAPMNILDQRLERSGWLEKLKDLGIEVHARSIFLQGLLLLDRNSIPSKFKDWKFIFNQWNDWLDENSEVNAAEACLSYIYNKDLVNKIIVGVENLKQFEELINFSSNLKEVHYPNLFIDDENLLHPSNWNDL